jgi:uncharacterized membrane protein HdeD (DUF308 family)
VIFRKLPPPTKFTISDKYRLVLGVVAIALGTVILWRTLSVSVSPPALMIGFAFIGFGVYRLWLGYMRLKQLKGRG